LRKIVISVRGSIRELSEKPAQTKRFAGHAILLNGERYFERPLFSAAKRTEAFAQASRAGKKINDRDYRVQDRFSPFFQSTKLPKLIHRCDERRMRFGLLRDFRVLLCRRPRRDESMRAFSRA
jgi:hypothetical protein